MSCAATFGAANTVSRTPVGHTGRVERSENAVEEVACDRCYQCAVVGDGDVKEAVAVSAGVAGGVGVLAGDHGGDGGDA